MVNQTIVDILVNRILNGGLNPITNEPIQVVDIKIQEYQDVVASTIATE